MNCKPILKNRFAAIVALFISLLMPTVAKAQEAYAVEDGTTLTFYYDEQRANRTGTVYGIDQKQESNNDVPAWAGAGAGQYNDRITKVVFDTSFQKYLPSSTSYWLYNCRKIAAIEGLDNLNTEKVTNMSYMFSACQSLTSLDVSSFDTKNVTDMSGMFNGCSALTSIFCDDTWTCEYSNDMFKDCYSLVGAVSYDANYVDVTMANPETGYFTKGGASSVSEINADAEGGATVIYNLHGVKMHDDLQSLPAGIYIVNGKKVIVK